MGSAGSASIPMGRSLWKILFCGMSRDILAEAMGRLSIAGYKIVMHVHDEAVIEAPMDAKLERRMPNHVSDTRMDTGAHFKCSRL